MNHDERTTRTTTDVSVPRAPREVPSPKGTTHPGLEAIDGFKERVSSSCRRWLRALGGVALGRRFGGRGSRESQSPTGSHDPHITVRWLVRLGEGRRGKRVRPTRQLYLAG